MSLGRRNMFTLREALNLIFTQWYFCKYSHISSSSRNIFHLWEFPLETLDKQRSPSSKQNQTDKSFYCSVNRVSAQWNPLIISPTTWSWKRGYNKTQCSFSLNHVTRQHALSHAFETCFLLVAVWSCHHMVKDRTLRLITIIMSPHGSMGADVSGGGLYRAVKCGQTGRPN